MSTPLSARLPLSCLPVAEARLRAGRASALLGANPRVRLVYLFGSATDSDAHQVHDIDLAVLTEPRLEFEELLRLRAALDPVVGDSLDLVSLADASVVLAHQICEYGWCLYCRSNEDEVRFVTQSRAAYWDFKPYLDEQWRLAGNRWEARRRGSEA